MIGISATVRRAFFAAVAFLWWAAAASAHNPDTSYVRCRIADDAIEWRFTFDVFTLLKIAPVDADHDGKFTREELRQAAPAIQRFVREHVRIDLNGTRADLGAALEPVWPKEAGESISAADWHSVASLMPFPFRSHLTQPLREVTLAFSVFDTFGSRHTVLGVFEVKGQTEEVTFTDAEPDYLFDVAYAKNPGGDSPEASTAGKSVSSSSRQSEGVSAALFRFFRLGVEHIFLGYDHICFLLALIVVSRVTELVKIVTSFTVAHSITLILATLKVVTLPSRLIETAIAATIVYVAAENLWRKHITRRWVLTFAFGLIHGFGFANVLAELGLPQEATIRCLLSFNVGVEVGQLAIVGLTLPLVWLLLKWKRGPQVITGISAAVGLFGLGWLIERAFGLSLMPF